MLELVDRTVAGRRFRAVVTERADGDLHPLRVPEQTLRARQRALTGRHWAMADQVHGAEVWTVTDADATMQRADVVVGEDLDVAIGVWTADCASLLFVTDAHRVVGVHAGWRGLAQGVLDVAIDEARRGGQSIEVTIRGPAIEPCCYAFGDAELAAVAIGAQADADAIRGSTAVGAPALDVPAVVDTVLTKHGLDLDAAAPGCTGCDDRWWSHRVGVDAERQALVGWWV